MTTLFQLLRFSAIFVLVSFTTISPVVSNEVIVVFGNPKESRVPVPCDYLAVGTFDKATAVKYPKFQADFKNQPHSIGRIYYDLNLTGSPGNYAAVATAEGPYRVKLTGTEGLVKGINTVGIEIMGFKKGSGLILRNDNEVIATVDLTNAASFVHDWHSPSAVDPVSGERVYNVYLTVRLNYDVIDEVEFFQYGDESFKSREHSFGHCQKPPGDAIVRWTKPQSESLSMRMSLEEPYQYQSTVSPGSYAYISFDGATLGHIAGRAQPAYTLVNNQISAIYTNLNVTETKTPGKDGVVLGRCSVVMPGETTVIWFYQQYHHQINMFSARLILDSGSVIVFRYKKEVVGRFVYKDIVRLTGDNPLYFRRPIIQTGYRPHQVSLSATVNFFCHGCWFDEAILYQRTKKRGEGMLASSHHLFGVVTGPVPANAVGLKRLDEREERQSKRIAKQLEATRELGSQKLADTEGGQKLEGTEQKRQPELQ